MFVPIAVALGTASAVAVLGLRSPLGRAVRLQFDLLAGQRGPEFDSLESYDEPVPAWLRPGNGL